MSNLTIPAEFAEEVPCDFCPAGAYQPCLDGCTCGLCAGQVDSSWLRRNCNHGSMHPEWVNPDPADRTKVWVCDECGAVLSRTKR